MFNFLKGNDTEKNNSIIVFVKWVLKWILKIVILLALTIGLVMGYEEFQSYMKHKTYDKISVQIIEGRYDKDSICGKDHNEPYEMRITNNSDKTIVESEIFLIVNKKGYSENEVDWKHNSVHTYKIIKPNEIHKLCFNTDIKKDGPITRKVENEEDIKTLRKLDIKNVKVGDYLYLANYEVRINFKWFEFED